MGHRSRYHDGLACFHLPVGRLPWVRTFAGLEAFLVLSVVYLLSNTAYGIIGKDSMRVWVPWCVGLRCGGCRCSSCGWRVNECAAVTDRCMPLCIGTPSVAGRALLLFVAIAMFFSSAFCRRSQCLACQRNRDAPASSASAQSVSLRSWDHPHLSRKADRREVSAVRRAPPPLRSRARHGAPCAPLLAPGGSSSRRRR